MSSAVETMPPLGALVSVYCDWAATEHAVGAAIEGLALPAGVTGVTVAPSSGLLGCGVVVDLVGTFDEGAEGRGIARAYAARLSEALRMPVFALHDLIMAGRADW